MIEFKIGICILTRDVWKSDFGQSLAMMCIATLPLIPSNIRLGIKIYNKTQCSIPHLARNSLALQALKDECTHVFFLDDDMRFPMETLADLLKANKDIIAGNCTTKEYPPRPTAERGPDKIYTCADSQGIEMVDSIGTAVLLIKADVLKKTRLPWFDYEWLEIEQLSEEMAQPDFDYTKMDTDRLKIRGEDRYFCKKARQAGFEIFIHHEISKKIGHVGDWPYCHQMIKGYRKGEIENGKTP